MASPLRNLGAGLLRGTTADVLGMPIDTLNMIRQGLLSPAQGGNPYARSIAGLLGPTQEVGSSDYFAQQMGLPQGEGLLYEGARMVSPSPTDLMSLARRAPIQELITYHGTPHRFEPTPANPLGEFEAAKIGSGEGAQKYGHGIYFAENPAVAKEYSKLTPAGGPQPAPRRFFNGNELDAGSPEYHAAALLSRGKSVASVRKEVEGWINDSKNWSPQRLAQPSEQSVLAGWQKTLDTLNQVKSKSQFKTLDSTGNLYTADLPDEMIDRMLDWDAPVDESFANKIINAVRRNDQLDANDFEDALGLSDSYGIPGIRYLDQGSRGAGEGTRNFVVFPGEEKKVKILKRD
jgi:hypothetical protein